MRAWTPAKGRGLHCRFPPPSETPKCAPNGIGLKWHSSCWLAASGYSILTAYRQPPRVADSSHSERIGRYRKRCGSLAQLCLTPPARPPPCSTTGGPELCLPNLQLAMHSWPATPSAACGHCWRCPPPLTRPSDGAHLSFPVGAGRTLSRFRGPPPRGLRCGGEAATACRAGLGGRQACDPTRFLASAGPSRRRGWFALFSHPPCRELLWPARSASIVPSRGGQAPPVPLVVSWPRYGAAGGPAAAV